MRCHKTSHLDLDHLTNKYISRKLYVRIQYSIIIYKKINDDSNLPILPLICENIQTCNKYQNNIAISSNKSLVHNVSQTLGKRNINKNKVLNKIANLFDHLLLSSLSPRLKTHRPFVFVFPLGITFSEVTLSFLFSLEVKSLIFSSPISVSLCDINHSQFTTRRWY